ncbi:uncharacterized protein LOC129583424 [Paramacrobiotus metropolitanus]|uniref:uncharacterized protein LOC129583424 n=1 Tax=Paramacrobiotus metropolitanus TaxID=2943436 RepID=UPI002445C472|nr:uncharacterized protein LOC129583424 [Paramacrobiotus metropolitanus]
MSLKASKMTMNQGKSFMEGTINFVIPDARLLTKGKKVYSSPIHIRNLIWRIFVVVEDMVVFGKPKPYVNVYLECDSSFGTWVCKTDMDFRFVPWIKTTNPLEKECLYVFTEVNKCAGFPNVISLNKMLDPPNGYIDPTTFTVALEVFLRPELPLVNAGIYDKVLELVHGLEDQLSTSLKYGTGTTLPPVDVKPGWLRLILDTTRNACQILSSIPKSTETACHVQQTYLLNNPEFGNIAVVAGKDTFHVDEEALARVSPVLLKHLEANKRSDSSREKPVYNFTNLSSSTVLDFLLYCYIGIAPTLEKNAREMLSLATFYGENRLKTLSEMFMLRDLVQTVSDFSPTVAVLSPSIDFAMKHQCDLMLAGLHLSLQEKFGGLSPGQQDEWRLFQRNIPEFIFRRIDFAVVVHSSLTKHYVEQEKEAKNYWEKLRSEHANAGCWRKVSFLTDRDFKRSFQGKDLL